MEPAPSLWLQRRRVRHVAPVAVVGGGLVGLSTAYWLSRFGTRSLVLEAGSVAFGASGRNAGFLLTGSAEPYLRLAKEVGEERALAFWRRSAENRELLRTELLDDRKIRCEFLPEGSWIAALDEPAQVKELKESAEALEKAGHELRWVEGYPLRRASGSRHLGGAIFQERDAGLDPVQLCQGLVQAGGLEVEGGCRVLGFEAEKGKVRLRCLGGDILAERVVVAANAFAPKLLPHLEGRVRPVRGQMLATAPGDRPLEGVWYLDDGFQYLRQLRDGEVLLGGCRQVAEDEEVGFDLEPTSKVQDALEAFLSRTFPHLAGRPIRHRWAGTMAFTADSFPEIGRHPTLNNVLYAAGLTGHGLSLSFVLGRHLARMAQGEELEPFLPA